MAGRPRSRKRNLDEDRIDGCTGTASEDEPAVETLATDDEAPRMRDEPSPGDDYGDDTPHQIVMGGDDAAKPANSSEFQGISATSFAIPELDAKPRTSAAGSDGEVSVLDITGGVDDRNVIGNTRKYPYRAICALLMSGRGQTAMGTGWFAGPNLIVTAGHNLYNNSRIGKGWIEQVQIWPGRNGGSVWDSEFADRSQFGVSDAWLNETSDAQYLDYGVIRLTSNLGKKVGWFGLRYWPSNQLEGKDFNVVGYPQEDSRVTPWTMWYDIGRITSARKKTIEYEMDTTPGESGSPVVAWVGDRTEEGSMIVVGIHNYGKGSVNQATRITPTVLDTIKQLASS